MVCSFMVGNFMVGSFMVRSQDPHLQSSYHPSDLSQCSRMDRTASSDLPIGLNRPGEIPGISQPHDGADFSAMFYSLPAPHG